jgi:hypothetical protein
MLQPAAKLYKTGILAGQTAKITGETKVAGVICINCFLSLFVSAIFVALK